MRKELSPAQLRRRLISSIGTGILMTALGVSAFFGIRSGETVDEAPTVLRKAFLWNERLWSGLQSPSHLSVEKPSPPKGKKPRVNGNLGLEAAVDAEGFRMQVDSGERRISLPIGELELLPRVRTSTDFKCIEGWSEVMDYSGVRFSEFLESYQIGKKADGTYYRYVGLETPDREYYVSIDMESMLHPQTLLAFEMNEMPLAPGNGAPVRLMIPIKYGIKSLKRVGRIFFSDERPPDYWAEQGYDWYSGL